MDVLSDRCEGMFVDKVLATHRDFVHRPSRLANRAVAVSISPVARCRAVTHSCDLFLRCENRCWVVAALCFIHTRVAPDNFVEKPWVLGEVDRRRDDSTSAVPTNDARPTLHHEEHEKVRPMLATEHL